MIRIFLVFFILFLSNLSLAHDLGDGAHITTVFDQGNNKARWNLEITIQDLLSEFTDFDVDNNGRLTPMEYGNIDARKVAEYVMKRLEIMNDGGRCEVGIDRFNIITHKRADYLQFPLKVNCGNQLTKLSVNYNLFFDQNPYHQGTWTIILDNQPTLFYFWEDDRRRSFQVSAIAWWQVFADFLAKGIHHILIGFDHILFLVSLLLPAVLVRKGNQWQSVESFKVTFWYVVKIVTAFTVAHTITLSCAVLGWIPMPSAKPVEVIIAFSVFIMAFNNIRLWLKRFVGVITFAFGLIHGFGFASVLAEYPLTQESIALSLLSFNLGVEVGQLAIVLLLLPFLYYFRSSVHYAKLFMPMVSGIICVIAIVWCYQRLF